MPLNWSDFINLRNRNEIHRALMPVVTAANYGRAPGQWTLTELISERTNVANCARRLVEGVGLDGKPEKAGPIPIMIKLRVLSRQACMTAADGEAINTWDTTCTDKVNYNGELCPTVAEKPQAGDVVWVKGDAHTHDPVTGERLTRARRQAMVARKEAELGREIKPNVATHYWTEYPVDADGCITVSYLHACQLLTTKGKRLVLPQHTTSNRANRDKNIRMITNWLFEEVVPEPKKKPTATRVKRESN